jgi:hypothetical protein
MQTLCAELEDFDFSRISQPLPPGSASPDWPVEDVGDCVLDLEDRENNPRAENVMTVVDEMDGEFDTANLHPDEARMLRKPQRL